MVMGMNIKDPQVHAMARELAARRGSTVTDAVRRALRGGVGVRPCYSGRALKRAQIARTAAFLASTARGASGLGERE